MAAVVSILFAFMRVVRKSRQGMVRCKGIMVLMLVDTAVTPDEAAKTLVEWAEKLDMSKSGQYWAPRGSSTLLYLTVLVLCKPEKKC
jgi:hypothetical protein